MTIVTRNTKTMQAFAVLRFQDIFGSGYLVQATEHVATAIAEGWDVLVNGISREHADHICNIYKFAGAPETQVSADLDDLLTHDMTEHQEDRFAEFVQEFDIIQVPHNGGWIDGIITDIDFEQETVELDGFITISLHTVLKHGELIATADSDCGFIKEYGAYIDMLRKNMETLYAIAEQVAA